MTKENEAKWLEEIGEIEKVIKGLYAIKGVLESAEGYLPEQLKAHLKCLEYAKDVLGEKLDHLSEKYESETVYKRVWFIAKKSVPADRDWYLGIFKEPDTGWINPLPFICDYVGAPTKATTKENWILRGFTDRDDENGIEYYKNLECVAWTYLPVPPPETLLNQWGKNSNEKNS